MDVLHDQLINHGNGLSADDDYYSFDDADWVI